MRLPLLSAAMSVSISATFSAFSWPLTLKTTSPFAFLVILSICSLVVVAQLNGNWRSICKSLKRQAVHRQSDGETSTIGEQLSNSWGASAQCSHSCRYVGSSGVSCPPWPPQDRDPRV